MDVGAVLLLIFFVAIAWLLLRDKPGPHRVCTTCGHLGPTRTITKGSIWIEIFLWCFFILPGVIYSIWRHTTRRIGCSACGSEQVVPVDSPVGKKLIAEFRDAPAIQKQ